MFVNSHPLLACTATIVATMIGNSSNAASTAAHSPRATVARQAAWSQLARRRDGPRMRSSARGPHHRSGAGCECGKLTCHLLGEHPLPRNGHPATASSWKQVILAAGVVHIPESIRHAFGTVKVSDTLAGGRFQSSVRDHMQHRLLRKAGWSWHELDCRDRPEPCEGHTMPERKLKAVRPRLEALVAQDRDQTR